ncbi:porin [Celerinatantimonas sp. YJH-8]|uniref:porin n=1 Tax=Celerinatantimonas sp. YJH-8 TaxID=3228714 RepID=UPI0038C55ED8
MARTSEKGKMMAFNKHALSVLVGTVLGISAIPSYAVQINTPEDMPTINIYGKVFGNVQSADDSGTDGAESQISSVSSRFGVKGDYGLNDDLKLTYKMEWGVNLASQDSGSNNNITGRNQYIGVAGNFGEVRIGRHDTALKMSQGNVDQFNDLEGDMKFMMRGENRLGNNIMYLSPNVAGFHLNLNIVSEDNSAQQGYDGTASDHKTGLSSAITWGDEGLKKTPVYLAAAYDNKVNGYDVYRFTAQTKLGPVVLGGVVNNQKHVVKTASNYDDNFTSYMVSAAYNITSEYVLKAQYEGGKYSSDDVKPKMYSVGFDYKFSKPAKLYLYYTHADLDQTTTNIAGKNIDNANYFGGGLQVTF